MKQKQLDRQSKASLREIEKLCGKVEKLCVPLQAVLLRIAEEPLNVEVLQRLEQFQETFSIIGGGLYMIQHRSCKPGGGASQRMAAQIIERMRSQSVGGDATSDLPAGSPPSLKGSCQVFPIMSVLELLASQRKTGVMSLGLEDETVTLHIVEGAIVHVSCTPLRRGERLGEMLIEAGDVSIEHFMAFADTHRATGGLLGIALVDNKVVSEEALTRTLVHQLNKRLERVFASDDCSFEFHEGPIEAGTGLNISVAELLIDGQVEDSRGTAPTGVQAPAIGGPATGFGGDQSPSVADKWQGGSNDSWGSPKPS